jgi:hypothetical protein
MRFLILFFCLTFSLQSRATDHPVIAAAKAVEAQYGGRVGVHVAFADGNAISHRADERFPKMSTFKTLLCAAVLKKADMGTLDLSSTVTVQETDIVTYSPVVEKLVGTELSLMDACEATILTSDNAAANIVLKRLEVIARINERLMDHVGRYQQLVFGMIYAGYFALWFGIKGDGITVAMLLSGTSMLVSISIYGLWSIFGSNVMLKKQALAVDQLRNAENLEKQFELEMASDIAETSAKILRFQPVVFNTAVAAGIFAIGSLLFSYIHEITHLI